MLLLLILAAPAAADHLSNVPEPILTQDLQIPAYMVVTVSPTPTSHGMALYPQYNVHIDWEYVRKHPEMWPEWMCDKAQMGGGGE